MAVPLRPVAVRPRRGLPPAVSAYREYRPAPAVARAVACTWQGIPGWPRRLRLLPDGCLDLVWDGQRARVMRPAARPARQPVSQAGLVTGIRMRPGWAAAALGLPVRDLPAVADLAGLWDRAAVSRLEAGLAAADGPAASRAVLTAAIAGRLARSAGPRAPIVAAIGLLGQPGATAAAAARRAGVSPRQLRRQFEDQVGLPPKTLQTVLRLQRLRAWLAAAGPGPASLASAAAECGYFDQAHLSRDCARLAGVTPAVLLAASAAGPAAGARPGGSCPGA